MTDRSLIVLARVVAIVTVACGVLAIIVAIASGTDVIAGRLQELLGTVVIPVIVLIALPKVPRNGSVWAFAVAGLSLGMGVLGDAVAQAVSGISAEDINFADGVMMAPADLPLPAALGLQVIQSFSIPAFVLFTTLVLLLFPNGYFPKPQHRWRWVGIVTIAAVGVGFLATAWQYRPTNTVPYAELSQGTSIAGGIAAVATGFFILLAVVSIAGFIVKWKGSGGDERLQFRWVGFEFLAIAVWSLVGIAVDSVFVDVVSWVLVILLPVAYAVAILRYRLYGIDIVISKALTYGALAVFVTGVYVIVVVGIGSVFGRGDEPNLALSISAVAIVAVAFEPLRQRLQHWANALVYGQREAPYDVLASVTVRIADTRDPDEALAQITQLVADGTGAAEAALWLNVGVSLLPQAATPPKSLANLKPVRKGNGSQSEVPGDRSVAIRHRGDVMGVLSITKTRGESVTAADEKLLADVAASTGVLLRNIGLNAELIDRAGQLRLSRRRLVAVQDAERHRLERDLHDGAQQHVVALKVKLGIARTLAEREGAEPIAELVTDLSATTQRAVDGLRAVAHGIYPPLLEAEGLEAALRPTKRTASISVEIVVNRLDRYEQSVEESVYFAVLDTVNRAIDAGATRAVISLEGEEELVRFSVQVDAEVVDLTAVEDRIDAIGGTLIITREQGASVVSAEIPRATTSVVGG